MPRAVSLFVRALTLTLLVPALSSAQSAVTGTIAGVVRDTTGSVLPGVTVEASSPALIEKVRTAVTDEQGQYKILDLRPGSYTVKFTLSGFSAVQREGLELTTGFTARVDADLKVGSLTETITVTGASPIVDVQNVRTQNVLSREVIDTLPTGKTTQAFAALTLGATGAAQDVGGNTGEAATGFGVHGTQSNDGKHLQDGMQMSGPLFGGGLSLRLNFVNQMAVQEVAVTTRGASAETETGGPQINYVPKDGGNMFNGSFAITGAHPSMQSKDVTDAMRARGVTSAPSIKRIHDVGGMFGGPIVRDRLWFITSSRTWNSQNYVPGAFFADQSSPAARGGLIYIADQSRPAYTDIPNKDLSVRGTWQASPRHKFAETHNIQRNCNCYQGVSATRAPEATVMINYESVLSQVTWNHPRTSRLLFDGGFTGLHQTQHPIRPPGVSTTAVAVNELSTGLNYNAKADSVGTSLGLGGDTLAYVQDVAQHQVNGRFSMAYVTGSHAFKTGFTLFKAWHRALYKMNDPPVRYFFRNGVPAQIQEWIDPVSYDSRVKANLGLFVQDQWTVSRFTLNLGLRYDYINAYDAPVKTPAGLFVGERDFPAVYDVPNFKDINPRLGVAFDLFGNGKTALKAQIGRYVQAESTNTAILVSPTYTIAQNATRSWTDTDNDYVPDCVLTDPALNGECGPISNVNLGRVIPTTAYSDDVLRGFGNRRYTWEGSVTFQHELMPNLGLTGGYYRTWFGNFVVTDNLAVLPSNYDPYCVTAPTDTRLSSSGQQLCGLFDLNPTRFGQINNQVSLASNFGEQSQVYNGFDLALSLRFGRGGFLQGGGSTGQTVTDNCYVIDSPQQTRFCRVTTPFSGQTQFKSSVSYPLKWGLLASGVIQNLPGPARNANWPAPNAAIAPSLGRNLSAGATATATVALIEPNSDFEDRFTQVDVRLAKVFRFGGRRRVRADLDFYNLFNSRAVLGVNTTYGPAWLNATSILGGRMLKVGGQLDF